MGERQRAVLVHRIEPEPDTELEPLPRLALSGDLDRHDQGDPRVRRMRNV